MDLNNILIKDCSLINQRIKNILIENSIITIEDLLKFYPIKYQVNIVSTPDTNSDHVIFKGIISSGIEEKIHRDNLSSLKFILNVNDELIDVIVFNQAYLKKIFFKGRLVILEGKYDKNKKSLTVSNVFHKFKEGINSIYPKIENISDNTLKDIIKDVLNNYSYLVKEVLPEPILKKYRLLPILEFYNKVHFPKSNKDCIEVERRKKYEEFFLFELLIKAYQMINRKAIKEPLNYDICKVKEYIKTIPYELTIDQKNACNDIFRDLKASYPANRLIEGDVGSGKTVVASIALYAVKTANSQSALMAPTEILATQHYFNLCKLFKNVPMRIELLTSKIKGKKRIEILNDLKDGLIDCIVGTHALLGEAVEFNDLRMVVTDEQHRFGVNQRALLRQKGKNPDVISLTATPIPRTLAIVVFGDMDISQIKMLPSGRKEIITNIVNKEYEENIFSFIKKEIDKGNQAYIIAPMILESDSKESVYSLYDKANEYFNGNCLLLHGKLKPFEKDEIMEKFKNNEKQILVSTTVVEVGVDVENATVIAIFDASSFGLSQIHQLRGRVGRGDKQSYCFLIDSNVNKERLKILENVSDGFMLAEEDLRLRGPGDFFGSKQSGMPTFKYGNIINDYNILSSAIKDSEEIINNSLYLKDEYLCVLSYLKSFEFIKKGILD